MITKRITKIVAMIALCLYVAIWFSGCSSDPGNSENSGTSTTSVTSVEGEVSRESSDGSSGMENAGASVRTINDDSHYPEGPLWRDGKLYYTEYSNGKIMTYDGENNETFWREKGCGPSALIETGNGHLLVTCYDSKTLAEVGPDGETVRSIKSDDAGNGFTGPNDFAKDGRGGIYFSDSGTYAADAPSEGKVFYIAPGGDITEVARGLDYSNGLGLTPGGDRLLVAEMLKRRVLSYAVEDDGSLGERKVFARTEDLAPTPSGPGPLDGPDGLKVSETGEVYIAQNGAGRVLIASPDGELKQTVEVAADHVTNVAPGETPETLYITSAIDPNNEPYPGEVYEARVTGSGGR